MSWVEVCVHTLSYDQKSNKIMECIPHSHQYREQILDKFCADFMKEGNFKTWCKWAGTDRATYILKWLDRNTTVSTRTKKDYQAMFIAQIPRVLKTDYS